MTNYNSSATQEEKLWGMLGHVFGFAGYIVGLGQYIAPLVLFLIYKDKSKFIAFHALQSLFFQLLVAVALAVSGMLTVVLIGFVLLPVVAVVAIVYVIIAALRAFKGEWFEYWLVGKWARQIVGE